MFRTFSTLFPFHVSVISLNRRELHLPRVSAGFRALPLATPRLAGVAAGPPHTPRPTPGLAHPITAVEVVTQHKHRSMERFLFAFFYAVCLRRLSRRKFSRPFPHFNQDVSAHASTICLFFGISKLRGVVCVRMRDVLVHSEVRDGGTVSYCQRQPASSVWHC